MRCAAIVSLLLVDGVHGAWRCHWADYAAQNCAGTALNTQTASTPTSASPLTGSLAFHPHLSPAHAASQCFQIFDGSYIRGSYLDIHTTPPTLRSYVHQNSACTDTGLLHSYPADGTCVNSQLSTLGSAAMYCYDTGSTGKALSITAYPTLGCVPPSVYSNIIPDYPISSHNTCEELPGGTDSVKGEYCDGQELVGIYYQGSTDCTGTPQPYRIGATGAECSGGGGYSNLRCSDNPPIGDVFVTMTKHSTSTCTDAGTKVAMPLSAYSADVVGQTLAPPGATLAPAHVPTYVRCDMSTLGFVGPAMTLGCVPIGGGNSILTTFSDCQGAACGANVGRRMTQYVMGEADCGAVEYGFTMDTPYQVSTYAGLVVQLSAIASYELPATDPALACVNNAATNPSTTYPYIAFENIYFNLADVPEEYTQVGTTGAVTTCAANISPPSPPGDGGSTTTIIIVAAGAVGAALVLLVAWSCMKANSKLKPTSPAGDTTATASAAVAMASATVEMGVPMGNAVPVGGTRFDPETGAELPKFDPDTGKQNWWDEAESSTPQA